MAAQSRRREVAFSAAAVQALRDIWHWNAERYGIQRADSYLRYLEAAIGSLSRPDVPGRPVLGRPDLRCLLIRRRSGGHGHLAVFQLADDRITVLRIFHTAQDWQSIVSADAPLE